jgi:hypothetical protein
MFVEELLRLAFEPLQLISREQVPGHRDDGGSAVRSAVIQIEVSHEVGLADRIRFFHFGRNGGAPVTRKAIGACRNQSRNSRRRRTTGCIAQRKGSCTGKARAPRFWFRLPKEQQEPDCRWFVRQSGGKRYSASSGSAEPGCGLYRALRGPSLAFSMMVNCAPVSMSILMRATSLPGL